MADTTRDIVLRLEGKVNQLLGIVASLDKSINGNGTPGLKSEVRELHGRTDDIDKRHCDEDEKAKTAETRSWDIRKGVLLLTIGQVLTFGGLVVAVVLGFK